MIDIFENKIKDIINHLYNWRKTIWVVLILYMVIKPITPLFVYLYKFVIFVMIILILSLIISLL